MAKKLYVGNLDYGVDDAALEALFTPHGNVESAHVIKDRDTGRSKGFGFVEMNTLAETRKALSIFNGRTINGRLLAVREDRPQSKCFFANRNGIAIILCDFKSVSLRLLRFLAFRILEATATEIIETTVRKIHVNFMVHIA